MQKKNIAVNHNETHFFANSVELHNKWRRTFPVQIEFGFQERLFWARQNTILNLHFNRSGARSRLIITYFAYQFSPGAHKTDAKVGVTTDQNLNPFLDPNYISRVQIT